MVIEKIFNEMINTISTTIIDKIESFLYNQDKEVTSLATFSIY